MPSTSPFHGRIQKHALERLDFAPESARPERLAACKTFLRLESAMIHMRHDGGESRRDDEKGREQRLVTRQKR